MVKANALVVVPYSKATATSLTLPAQLDEARWEAIGEFLSRVEGGVQWWIGDWWRFGEQRYGDRKAWAEAHGMNYGSCADAAWVAGAIESSDRSELLSWTHHRVVTALPVDKRVEWLRRAERESLSVSALRKAIGGPMPEAMTRSDSPEWYTPPEIVAAAQEVLGQIDLDPCSNDADEPNVPAVAHYTQPDDGLTQLWGGKVYMNPPYGDEIIGWVRKLVDEHESGRVPEAIALVPARVDTQWWQLVRDLPVCFVEGRLKFVGAENSAPFPSAVLYLGDNLGRFLQVFGELGNVYQRVSSDI